MTENSLGNALVSFHQAHKASRENWAPFRRRLARGSNATEIGNRDLRKSTLFVRPVSRAGNASYKHKRDAAFAASPLLISRLASAKRVADLHEDAAFVAEDALALDADGGAKGLLIGTEANARRVDRTAAFHDFSADFAYGLEGA